jgi:hypothetical protein
MTGLSPDTGIDAQPDRIQLSKNWGLRKLNEGDLKRERWALQYLGMDWLVISEFLPPGKDGVCTIGDELRKFASEVTPGDAQSQARLIEALEFIRDSYDNHDVNHVDFRVKAYQVALDALGEGPVTTEQLDRLQFGRPLPTPERASNPVTSTDRDEK